MKDRKFAFTLAELLITLAILGIVAAIVIPATIQNYDNTINMVKLKKTVSYIENKFSETLAIYQCSTIGCVLRKNGTYKAHVANTVDIEDLRPFFPEIENDRNHRCVPRRSINLQGQTASVHQKNNDRNPNGIDGRAKVDFCLSKKDNIGLTIWDYSFNNNHYLGSCDDETRRCAVIIVHLRGGKRPSKFGRDAFEFSIAGNGEISSFPNLADEAQCDPINGQKTNNGLGCLHRIMRNNWKIDY